MCDCIIFVLFFRLQVTVHSTQHYSLSQCRSTLPNICVVGDLSENKKFQYIKQKVMSSSKSVDCNFVEELKNLITGFCTLSVSDK
jgi:hypothetical protein